ncbi:MAG: universal stress protein [Rhodothermales bacterium]
MLQINRILAPIDFSKHSERALAHACEITATHQASLALLHVIEEPTFPAMYGAVMHELYGKVPDVTREALEALQRVLDRCDGPEVETTLHAIKGRAGTVIIDFAEKHDIDLIVMPTHGLSGLEHLLLGSVAEKVIRHALCPVLIVKVFGKSLLPSPGE